MLCRVLGLLSLFVILASSSFVVMALNKSENANSSEAIVVTLLADIEYRPYSYVDNGQMKGLLIDIVRAVDAELPNYSIEFSPKRWPIAKQHVREGGYLGLIGPYFHASDWPYMYPYSYPLHFEQLVTVCNKDLFKNKIVEWPINYAGLTVGTVAGYDGWLDDGVRYREINSINFFEFPTTTLALQGVSKDIIDCTLFEKATFNETLKYLIAHGKIAKDHSLTIVNEISLNSVHIGYSEAAYQSNAFPYAYDFQKAFDAKLFELLKSGQLAALFEMYGVEYQ